MDELAGFAPWERRSPFADAAGPLLFRAGDDGLTFAVRVTEQHANARGQAHGGMLSTFADLAIGYAMAFSTDPPTRLRTVSLSIDFIAGVDVGDVLTARPEVHRVGSRLAHGSAVIMVGERAVARASCTAAVMGDR